MKRTNTRLGNTKFPPLILTFLLLVLMWMADTLTPQLAFDQPGSILVGLFLMTSGIAACALGVWTFRRASTTLNPVHPERASALVVTGVYRYTRNPMYLGFALVLLGWSAVLANPLALVFPVAFVAYMDRVQIASEEGALSVLFGDSYREYQANVRRWL